MLGLDKKGTRMDREQVQIPGGRGKWQRDVPRNRGREEVSKGLSGWALVESVLGSDALAPYVKLSVPFPGQ